MQFAGKRRRIDQYSSKHRTCTEQGKLEYLRSKGWVIPETIIRKERIREMEETKAEKNDPQANLKPELEVMLIFVGQIPDDIFHRKTPWR